MLGRYYLSFFHLASAFARAFLCLSEPPASFKANSFSKAPPTFSDFGGYVSEPPEYITLTSALAHVPLNGTRAPVSLSQGATCSCLFQESSNDVT